MDNSTASETSKTKFLINFQYMMMIDSPSHIGQQVYLKFIRNKNELNTKATVVNNNGQADFQEKIEMKSFFDWDKAANKFKPKMSELQALTKNGQLLGTVPINLSDYARINVYKQQLKLKPAVKTVGNQSFIQVEIETQDQSTASARGKEVNKKRTPGGTSHLIE